MTHIHFCLVNLYKISACLLSLNSKRVQPSNNRKQGRATWQAEYVHSLIPKFVGGQHFSCASQGTEHFSCQVLRSSWCCACGSDEDGDVQSDDSQPEDASVCKVSTTLAAQKEGVKSWCYLKSVEVLDAAVLKTLTATNSTTWPVSFQKKHQEQGGLDVKSCTACDSMHRKWRVLILSFNGPCKSSSVITII